MFGGGGMGVKAKGAEEEQNTTIFNAVIPCCPFVVAKREIYTGQHLILLLLILPP